MNQLSSVITNHIRDVNKLALIFVVLQFTKPLGFIPPVLDMIGYALMAVMAFVVVFKLRALSSLMLILIFYLGLNIILCHPDAIFRSWPRYLLFVLLLIVVSPLAQSPYLRTLREDMLNLTLWFGAIFSICSFFCYFLGINFMMGLRSDYNTAGTFAGLFNQSMMLGPIAGISSVFLAYKAYISHTKPMRNLYVATSLACLAAVFFSASRSALLCTLVGIGVMLLHIMKSGTRFLKFIVLILFVAALTLPIWGGILDGVIQKNEANLAKGSFLTSREEKWNARISEFESSPIIGIGFATVDPALDVVGLGGTIEPGSSWLAVLSMSGIIGGILFLSVFFSGYKACRKMHSDKDALLSGLLTLFAVHMIAEGYVFAAGSFLCYLLWLVVGCCFDRKYE